MDAFFRTHTYLVEHNYAPVRRMLMDEIDWNDQLIGIKRNTWRWKKRPSFFNMLKKKFGANDRKMSLHKYEQLLFPRERYF